MELLKKIVFLLAIIWSGNTYSQGLSFDETLAYINEKIVSDKCGIIRNYGGENTTTYFNPLTAVTATTSGDVVFTYIKYDGEVKLNLFDIKEGPKLTDDKLGVFFLKGDLRFHIAVSDYADAERLLKAFLHLKSLCTKANDPFND